jgi:hypothetical protein
MKKDTWTSINNIFSYHAFVGHTPCTIGKHHMSYSLDKRKNKPKLPLNLKAVQIGSTTHC